MKILAFIKNLFDFGSWKEKIVAFICGAEALPKPLTPEQEAEMVALAAEGDEEARDKLIEHNLRLWFTLPKNLKIPA